MGRMHRRQRVPMTGGGIVHLLVVVVVAILLLAGSPGRLVVAAGNDDAGDGRDASTMTSSSSSSSSSSLSSNCQVLNAAGDDVTKDVWVTKKDDEGGNVGDETGGGEGDSGTDVVTVGTIRSDELLPWDGYVQCAGPYACQNYTISNCPAVLCTGDEACFYTTMIGITHAVECHGTHSCHRSTIQLATTTQQQEVHEEEGEERDNDPTTIDSSSSRRRITCQGEGACDVAQITAPSAQLECTGRKACRKIDAQIDVVHCTHGDADYEACTGFASMRANCVLCGWLGCNRHINYCRTKHYPPPSSDEEQVGEQERWAACIPDTATGPGCTDEQIASLAEEIDTQGKV